MVYFKKEKWSGYGKQNCSKKISGIIKVPRSTFQRIIKNYEGKVVLNVWEEEIEMGGQEKRWQGKIDA